LSFSIEDFEPSQDKIREMICAEAEAEYEQWKAGDGAAFGVPRDVSVKWPEPEPEFSLRFYRRLECMRSVHFEDEESESVDPDRLSQEQIDFMVNLDLEIKNDAERFFASPEARTIFDDWERMRLLTYGVQLERLSPSVWGRLRTMGATPEMTKEVNYHFLAAYSDFDLALDDAIYSFDPRLGDREIWDVFQEEIPNPERSIWRLIQLVADLTQDEKRAFLRGLLERDGSVDRFLDRRAAAEEAEARNRRWRTYARFRVRSTASASEWAPCDTTFSVIEHERLPVVEHTGHLVSPPVSIPRIERRARCARSRSSRARTRPGRRSASSSRSPGGGDDDGGGGGDGEGPGLGGTECRKVVRYGG
jgi:hypothetical protein